MRSGGKRRFVLPRTEGGVADQIGEWKRENDLWRAPPLVRFLLTAQGHSNRLRVGSMDLEAEQVQSVVENVETVEVVAGDDIDSATSSHGLMDQQMIVTHPQEILVPTTEVHSVTLNFLICIMEL